MVFCIYTKKYMYAIYLLKILFNNFKQFYTNSYNSHNLVQVIGPYYNHLSSKLTLFLL